jgi:hypothetical protein
LPQFVGRATLSLAERERADCVGLPFPTVSPDALFGPILIEVRDGR